MTLKPNAFLFSFYFIFPATFRSRQKIGLNKFIAGKLLEENPSTMNLINLTAYCGKGMN